jgi:hypothetical protein
MLRDMKSLLMLIAFLLPQAAAPQGTSADADQLILKDKNGTELVLKKAQGKANRPEASATAFLNSGLIVITWGDGHGGGFGCDVGWGQNLARGFKAVIPESQFPVPNRPPGTKWERCSQNMYFVSGPTRGARAFIYEPDLAGVKVWYECQGGPIFDQYGSSVKLKVEISGVPAGTSAQEKTALGCSPPLALSPKEPAAVPK